VRTAWREGDDLVAAALHDGAIGSLDDRCDLYLPWLRDEGAMVRNVTRMCSGAAWAEELACDRRRMPEPTIADIKSSVWSDWLAEPGRGLPGNCKCNMAAAFGSFG
jgi:hypothetical protein